MKKCVLLLFAVFSCLDIFSQNFEVRVYDENKEPLPYACIYRNGEPLVLVDTLGYAGISSDKLHLGDTLATTYIGMDSKSIVYTPEMQGQGKYEFVLSETMSLELDEVVVRADIEKMFKKYVELYPSVNYNSILTGRFDMDLYYSDGTSDTGLSGSFTLGNEPRGKGFKYYYQNGYFYRKISREPQYADTLSDQVDHYLYLSLNHVNYALRILENMPKNMSCRYEYLGKDSGNRIFRVVFSNMGGTGTVFQYVLYADEQTKQVKNVEIQVVAINQNEYNIKAECEVREQHKPSYAPILHVKGMEYSLKLNSGSKVDMKLSDLSLEYTKW